MVLVPARNEADRVGATVAALRAIPEVDEVVVVDDGSSDGTGSRALEAGATVLQTPRKAGKGRALEGALRRLPAPEVWLADADGRYGGARARPDARARWGGRPRDRSFPPERAAWSGKVAFPAIRWCPAWRRRSRL
jgi:glycosyltransferase involved in cell wall biosynthesis